MLKKIIVIVAICLLLYSRSAHTIMCHVTAEYQGDASYSVAAIQDQALKAAMQEALSSAGTYVAADTQTVNGQLKFDDVTLLHSGVISIQKKKFEVELRQAGLWARCTLDANVDIDNLRIAQQANLARLEQAKREVADYSAQAEAARQELSAYENSAGFAVSSLCKVKEWNYRTKPVIAYIDGHPASYTDEARNQMRFRLLPGDHIIQIVDSNTGKKIMQFKGYYGADKLMHVKVLVWNSGIETEREYGILEFVEYDGYTYLTSGCSIADTPLE